MKSLISQENISDFRISLELPKGCEDLSEGCDFFLGINTNSEDDSFLDFKLEGKSKGWIAVGFTKTPDMVMGARDMLSFCN